MVLINDQISFTGRLLYPRIYYWAGTLLLCTVVLLFVSPDLGADFIVPLATAVLLFVFALIDGHGHASNWIELIQVDEQNETCRLKLLKKNKAFMDEVIPVKELRFEMVPMATEYEFYQLNIYRSGQMIFSQKELHSIGKKKMEEVVKYFHGE